MTKENTDKYHNKDLVDLLDKISDDRFYTTFMRSQYEKCIVNLY